MRIKAHALALLLTLAAAWLDQAGASTTPMDDLGLLSERTIFTLPATNPAVFLPPKPLDPHVRALRQLLGTEPMDTGPAQLVALPGFLSLTSSLSLASVVMDDATQRKKALEYIQRAQGMIRGGNTQAAVDYLTRSLKKFSSDPARARIHYELGKISFRKLDYKGAVDSFDRALNLDPANVGLAINLAATYLSMQNIDRADKLLSRINLNLVNSPSLLFAAHFNKACIHSVRKDADRAFGEIRLAILYDPVATMASLGDPQLDFIRADPRFLEISEKLETLIRPREKPPFGENAK